MNKSKFKLILHKYNSQREIWADLANKAAEAGKILTSFFKELQTYQDGFNYMVFHKTPYNGTYESLYCTYEIYKSEDIIPLIGHFDFIVTDNPNYENDCIVHHCSTELILDIRDIEISSDGDNEEIIDELKIYFPY